MVQFTYNLRRFGKKGSRNMKDYDGVESSSGSRRMGPGGPGGPPPGCSTVAVTNPKSDYMAG